MPQGSRAGEVKFAWGDDETTFRLGIKQLRELQEACDAGPAHIAKRLRDGTWFIQDIRETIRLGLIGAGMDQQQALAKVMNHVDQYPLSNNILPAWVILQGAIIGITEEQVGKVLEEETTKARSSRKAKSPSQDSTAPAP